MSHAPIIDIAPPPAAHGGDGARLAAALGVDPDDVLDLSASLNPCAPDVVALAARRLGSLRRYPDPADAAACLAQAIGVDGDRLVLTVGGSEAIALVAGHLGTGHVEGPEFSLYERHLAPGEGRWRSNPNNPRGTLAAPGDRAAVWDEAFWPLATGTWTRGDADHSGVGGGAVVVGSLTKVFACPGLRVGYVVAPTPEMADAVRRRQPLWSVSGLACALVPDLLDRADLPTWQAAVADLRADLTRLLQAHGHAVSTGDAPWVLVSPAGDLRHRLALHGILVRHCASFGLADTVRIAVPGAAGLDRLASAL